MDDPRVMSASAGCALQAKNSPEVERVLEELRFVTDRCDNLVARLATKVSIVTTPEPPICENGKEPSYSTSLACWMDDVRKKLKDIADRLESLHDRIEL